MHRIVKLWAMSSGEEGIQSLSQLPVEVILQSGIQKTSHVPVEVILQSGFQKLSQIPVEILIQYGRLNITKNFDSRQLIYTDSNKKTFVPQEFVVCIYEEEWITTTSSNGFIEIYNNNVGCLPIVTLTISGTYETNPKLRFYNGSTYKDISLGTFITSEDSPISIYSEDRYAKKNLSYFLPSYFPQINNSEYFSIEFIDNGSRVEVPISLYYKRYDNSFQIINFRGNITLQNVLNQIDLSKDHYTFPNRNKFVVNNEVSFEFERKMIADQLDQITDETKTYRVELIGINEDDNSQVRYYIGNVTFNNLSVNVPENDIISDKISGTGVWL